MKSLMTILKRAAVNWWTDDAMLHGAALAFYAILSVAPLLVIAVVVAGAVVGEEVARGELEEQMRHYVGPKGAEAIQEILVHAGPPKGGALATTLGIAILLIGASGVVAQLQASLNAIWNVRLKPAHSIGGFIQLRFVSMGVVLGMGLLLLALLGVNTAMAAIGGFLGEENLLWTSFSGGVDWLISFTVIFALVAISFKFLPDAKVAWRAVALGALLTTLLLSLGKFAIGRYLSTAGITTVYGAAGSLVMLVLWIYYSAQILFFGAEFTQLYAEHIGRPIEPASDAERVV
jgi:membrane protein